MLGLFSTVQFHLRLLKLYLNEMMRYYAGLYVLYIFIIGLTGASSETNNGISESRKMDNLCGSYVFNTVKPMIDIIRQLKQENVESKQKDKEIQELNKETLQLQQKIAKNVEKDQLFELYRATADSNTDHIRELKKSNDFYMKLIGQKPKNEVSVQVDVEQLRTVISEAIKNDFQKVADSLDKFKGQSEEFNKLRDKFEIGLRKKDKIINESRETISKLKSEVEKNNKELQKVESYLREEEILSEKLKATLSEKENIITQLRKHIENKTNELTETVTHYNELKLALKTQTESVQEKVEDISEETAENSNSYETLSAVNCTSTGTIQIEVAGMAPFKVLCDGETAGPGWITIQQRINGIEIFQRDWATYRMGFGSFNGDFFLGLEKIHRLTSSLRHVLYIFMERFSGATSYAQYNNFRISGESDQYELISLGNFSGNATDNLKKQLNQKFSTMDKDNDASYLNCAASYHGGWWYKNCTECLLNGKYHPTEVNQYATNWWDFAYSLKTIKMLIRPFE